MPNKLFVRALSLPEKEGEQLTHFEWALYARAGQKLAGGLAENFAAVSLVLEQNSIEGVQVVGLIPSNMINSTRVTIPGKQTRFVQQALPFVVEELLAEDLDSVHIALGERNTDASYSVEVINRNTFELFYSALEESGYAINAIYSDASLLPIKDTDISVAFEKEWSLLSIKENSTSRVKVFNLVSYFESVVKPSDVDNEDEIQTEKSYQVNCYISPDEIDSHKLLLAELQQINGLVWTTVDLNIPVIDLLCESWFQQGTQGINLCQGEFKLSKASSPSLKKWAAVAAVAGVWFLLQVGLDIGKGYYYQSHADQYQQEALQVYKKIFPAERRVSVNNLRRTLQGKLKLANSSGGETDFLGLLSETGYQYSKIPDSHMVQFKSVNFSDQRQELTIELKAGSFQQLDQLKNGLTSAGLGAKISSVVNEKNNVRGRLSVTGS